LQGKRNKTDPVDAALIAEYCAVFSPWLWSPPTPARRTLRDLVRVREALKISIVEWQNRLGAGKLDEDCACIIRAVITKLADEMSIAEASIRMTIEGDGDLQDDYSLLTSIPAIGSQTATIIMVELPRPTVLKTAREAAAYAGLNPCENRSGKTCKPTHISRIGNVALRRALYLPALAAFRFNPLVKALRERLEEPGRLRPQQIAAAAMRKLLHLCSGVLKTRKPFDPLHCSAFAAAQS
jgi:transposase